MTDLLTFPFVPSPKLLAFVVQSYEVATLEVADDEASVNLAKTIRDGLRGLCITLQEDIKPPFFLSTDRGELEPVVLECLLSRIHCNPSGIAIFSREFARSILDYAKKDYPSTPRIVIHESGRSILLPYYSRPKPRRLLSTHVKATVAKFGQNKTA